jgi:hypothetical protein
LLNSMSTKSGEGCNMLWILGFGSTLANRVLSYPLVPTPLRDRLSEAFHSPLAKSSER